MIKIIKDKMKFITCHLIFVILLLLTFPNIGNAATGPKLVCDEPVYQFGHVDQSAVVTNVFLIRNEGDMTFIAGVPRTTCGCTAVRLSKQMIGPGETVELIAVFTAAGRSRQQKKAIGLPSADLQIPLFWVYMEGFVEPPPD